MDINIEKIKVVELGNYGLSYLEIQALSEAAKMSGRDHEWDLIVWSYKYGFMRGQRAEHARQKRGKKQA